MSGSFSNTVKPDAPATAFFTSKGVVFRWGDDPDESYVAMSEAQAKAVRDRLNQMFPVAKSTTICTGDEYSLDRAWAIVDSQGGRPNPFDPKDALLRRNIAVACSAIEALGGMDPCLRSRPLPASQTEGMAA